LDKYPTEEKVTQALLDRVEICGSALEACAGAGQMAQVLRSHESSYAYDTTNDVPLQLQPGLHGRRVWTNDIDPTYMTDYGGDAGDPSAPVWERKWNWVVTNPPFSEAHRILPVAWDHCRVGVAFLLRLTYLEPCANREDWLKAHSRFMSNLIIFGQPRPSFTGDGSTDSVTTAWMVWRKNHHGGLVPDFVTKWKK
jgi:hypothetical protein